MNRQRRQRRLEQRIKEVIAQAKADGRLRPGEYYEVTVRHEDGCSLLTGTGECNCNPVVLPPEHVPAAEEN